MKKKLISLFSLINILFLISVYLGLFKPLLQEDQKLTHQALTLTNIVAENRHFLDILTQSLNKFKLSKKPSSQQLTKMIIKLAKQSQLTLKHIEPINADNGDPQDKGLAIQTTGSYQNTLKFIFYINQSPFLLHWSNILLIEANTQIEFSGNILKNE